MVAWTVVEAKDERGAVASAVGRAALFKDKAKYITADTAWLLMADPDMLVARPVQRSSGASNDIELPLADLSIESLADAFAPLAAWLLAMCSIVIPACIATAAARARTASRNLAANCG
jgi:hypothetical protein